MPRASGVSLSYPVAMLRERSFYTHALRCLLLLALVASCDSVPTAEPEPDTGGLLAATPPQFTPQAPPDPLYAKPVETFRGAQDLTYSVTKRISFSEGKTWQVRLAGEEWAQWLAAMEPFNADRFEYLSARQGVLRAADGRRYRVHFGRLRRPGTPLVFAVRPEAGGKTVGFVVPTDRQATFEQWLHQQLNRTVSADPGRKVRLQTH